jgi:acetolactate decarboxylase
MRLLRPAALAALSLITLLCACAPKKPGVLYQLAAFDTFAAGAYAGRVAAKDLAAHGDFGLGTVDGLAGEMIVLDGKAWLAGADMRVRPVGPAELSPFAVLTFFRPEIGIALPAGLDMVQLGLALDEKLPPGTFAAARITGRFSYLTIRSVAGFSAPYPPLAQALTTQSVQNLAEAEGTIVAVRGPARTSGVWVPGWHFHFLSADKSTGGHVLHVTTKDARAKAMGIKRFELELP